MTILSESTGEGKSAILILSHLMNRDGKLGGESIARIAKAAGLFPVKYFDFLITSGWDYRKDCALKIADVVSDYLVDQYKFDRQKIFVESNSRDTVGDAVFVRENVVKPNAIRHLTVVTSEYHVERTNEIFDFFYKDIASIEVIGVSTESDDNVEILSHERRSLESFRKTFDGVNASDIVSVLSVISERHPFYNGEVFPRLSIVPEN